MDPVTELVALVRPRTVATARLEAFGPWAVTFHKHPHIKFGTIVDGSCVIIAGATVRFTAGDFYLLASPPRYVMASSPSVRPRAAGPLFAASGGVSATIGRSGPRTLVVGGHFDLAAEHASLLLAALPPILRIPAASAGPLRELHTLIAREAEDAQLGSELVLGQLALVVLAYGMRAHGATADTGLLRALADPAIGRVLGQLHGDVRARPTLAELARVAGMSRSAFAAQFKQLVGVPPGDYALRWRMQLARDRLRTTAVAIKALAFDLGYASESAFSAAFHREVGVGPRAFRRAGEIGS